MLLTHSATFSAYVGQQMEAHIELETWMMLLQMRRRASEATEATDCQGQQLSPGTKCFPGPAQVEL